MIESVVACDLIRRLGRRRTASPDPPLNTIEGAALAVAFIILALGIVALGIAVAAALFASVP